MNALNINLGRGALALVVVVTMSATAVAQSSRVDRGFAARDKFVFLWETRLDPPVPPLAQSLGTATLEIGTDIIQRVILDRAAKMYFGYNVRVEPLPDRTFRVTFQPLTLSPELQRALGSDAAAWKVLPAPGFPEPRTIRPSDVLELRLLTGSTWGQTLTDYVTVREPEGPRVQLELGRMDFSFAPGNPRDFRLEDVELRLEQPSIVALGRDGALRDADTGSPFLASAGDVAGALVWVYIPNRGRYLLSLTPRSGFTRAGEVRGSSVRFRMDDESINIATRSRIAPGDAAFNLYVKREPKWLPTYTHANRDAIIIGTD
jgi:hypothetical protein